VDYRQDLNDLFSALGLPALSFDRNGCARMLFEGDVVVNFERNDLNGLLHLYCDLGALPSGDREALYLTLLEANLFGVQTRGATLALDTKQDQVVLWRSVHIAALTLSSCSEILNSFVERAAHWRTFLGAEAQGVEPMAGDAAPTFGFMGLRVASSRRWR
jgi:hypothetical protein